MNPYLPWAVIALVAVAILLGAIAWWRHRHWNRREQALRALLDGADRLEADIRKCRSRLGQAHAAMAISPGVPAAGSADARSAIDTALRDLLAHRLWIRDHAATATQAELDNAVAALGKAHADIRGLLATLGEAQRELDAAVRDHAAP